MRSLVLTAFTVLFTIVLVLVGGRFLALLVDANRDSELVSDLFRYSNFWVEPFFSIFNLKNEAVEGGGTFEPASLIAFLFYLIAGGLIGGVLSGAYFGRLHHA